MQYFQNICLYDSKINGFRDFLKSNILSFSILFIPIHNKKNGSNVLKHSKINGFRDFKKLHISSPHYLT